MKTKFKTPQYPLNYSILKNRNFLNNQNYVLGKIETKNVIFNIVNTNIEYLSEEQGKYYKNDLFSNNFFHFLSYLKIIVIFFLIFIILNADKFVIKNYFLLQIIGSGLIIFIIYQLFNKLNYDKKHKNYKIYKDGEFFYYKLKKL